MRNFTAIIIVSSLLLLGLGGLALFSPTFSGFFAGLAGSKPFPVVDFSTIKSDPQKDDFLVCPSDLCVAAEAVEAPPFFNLSVSKLRDRLLRYVDSRVEIQFRGFNPSIQQYDFLEKTSNMRFPDIVTVRLIPVNDQLTTLAIYSVSPLDNGEDGENERRVRRWLETLELMK